jgi:hypothetical protein
MPLGNYVLLEQGVPERMHFSGHAIEVRTITDPQTGRPGTRNVLVMDVDRLNGNPTTAKFSTMAETLYRQFEPYLPNQVYRNYEFIVKQTGSGFQTRYTVDRIPFVPTPAPA